MRYEDIRALPTTFNSVEKGRSHESLLRAFHILEKVKFLLNNGVASPPVLLELIKEMEGK